MRSASRTGAEDLAPPSGQPGSVTASQDAPISGSAAAASARPYEKARL